MCNSSQHSESTVSKDMLMVRALSRMSMYSSSGLESYLEHLYEGHGQVQVDDVAKEKRQGHEETNWQYPFKVELPGQHPVDLHDSEDLHEGAA